jgi:hypothetical protein
MFLQRFFGFYGYLSVWMQQNTSTFPLFFLFSSKIRTATKVNIWNKKSNITAIAACKQNVCNAGIFVKLPTKNARASHIVAVAILGPTYFSPSTTRTSSLSDVCLSIEFFIINMLSTPIARTRNGIT